jgi:uncharacterized protein (DUF1786 family)
MKPFLMIDIGAGTMDIMCLDVDSGQHFKAVAVSPVRHMAREIEQIRGPLAVTGTEMGGGPVTDVLKKRARQDGVLISRAAAATLHHDMDRVESWDLVLADSKRLEQAIDCGTHTSVVLGDIQPGRIAKIVEGLGFAMDFEVVAMCAQDHGVAPKGVSHLDFRHNLFEKMLDENPVSAALMFSENQVPKSFNRLAGMASDAQGLNCREVYVMDSGMAAVTGAVLDGHAIGKSTVAVLDVATSHTVVATIEDGQIAGIVEYHTRDVTAEGIDGLIRDLADGRVEHKQILAQGGHGAYLRKPVGFDKIQAIIATGPRRGIMAESRLPVLWGAPWGDNMMTGTVGLLEAVCRKKNLGSFAGQIV